MSTLHARHLQEHAFYFEAIGSNFIQHSCYGETKSERFQYLDICEPLIKEELEATINSRGVIRIDE